MINVEQAIEAILSRVSVVDTEERTLLGGLGQVVAEDVIADIDVPGRDTAAVDGYAVRSEDTAAATPQGPRYLRVGTTIAAGSGVKCRVTSGTAVRIMTGANLPEGANGVIRFEDTGAAGNRLTGLTTTEIAVQDEVKAGANVRKAGENIARGALVIHRGTAIGPVEASILGLLGHRRIRVVRRPVVAILATGDELVGRGTLSEGKIFDGNSYGLAAQVRRCGGVPRLLGIARDTRASLIAKIRKGMGADAIVTSGGVSMGDYDLVKDVLTDLGEVVFSGVRMSPGQAFAFAVIKGQGKAGRARSIPHFALTGSPTGCAVNFEVLVRPAILKMLGQAELPANMVEAVMENPVDNRRPGQHFAHVKVSRRNGGYYARLTRSNGGVLPSVAAANGLAVVPEGTSRVERGSKLRVMMLDGHQEF